jgi:hypothetical protein
MYNTLGLFVDMRYCAVVIAENWETTRTRNQLDQQFKCREEDRKVLCWEGKGVCFETISIFFLMLCGRAQAAVVKRRMLSIMRCVHESSMLQRDKENEIPIRTFNTRSCV